eukprot:CAMPEP_0194489676 /NCGR_PEP_ID=MMETSP0253-20130528/9135_1 /TAXON_ID=2966 /ORGANISM="Noctiluca scintillans" /LENGTH=142 /DNA_ID=CAMNT_0039330177 /DNA_START=46 /DNA_END=471 /DNA_ORIENTATION=-
MGAVSSHCCRSPCERQAQITVSRQVPYSYAHETQAETYRYAFEEASDDKSTELLVDVNKSSAMQDLGMNVLHRGLGILMISEISTNGAVDVSNQKNRKLGLPCLEIGDQIAMVNGVGGDDIAMAEECHRAQHLIFGIRRAGR